MFGRENVIKAIEHHIAERGYCRGCTYEESYAPNGDCGIFVDALALLREQEAVKPISAHVWAHTFGRCGNCEAPLPALEGLRSKFCWMCGKAVKWDA